MNAIILTPIQLFARLAVVPADFEKVLREADDKDLNVLYHFKATGFGNFPMNVQVLTGKAELNIINILADELLDACGGKLNAKDTKRYFAQHTGITERQKQLITNTAEMYLQDAAQ